MTEDTIFDLASLTCRWPRRRRGNWPSAASSSSMRRRPATGRPSRAARQGPITVAASCSATLPGLRAGLPLKEGVVRPRRGAGADRRRMPQTPPGSAVLYSDEFHRARRTGAPRLRQTLAEVPQAHVFAPLGMNDSAASCRSRRRPRRRCARHRADWLPCAAICASAVHDPLARRMGGVAGNAGLFRYGRRSGEVRPRAIRRRPSSRRSRARYCSCCIPRRPSSRRRTRCVPPAGASIRCWWRITTSCAGRRHRSNRLHRYLAGSIRSS